MNRPLNQSVMKRNTKAKLWGNPGERSQGGTARGHHEEARFRGPMGLHLGPNRGRASRHWAKSAFSASSRRTPAAALTASSAQTVRVVHAITRDTGHSHITGEVPPGPAKTQVTAGYKNVTKGQPQARAAVTASYRHRLQGCQQRPSSPHGGDERQNLKQPVRAPVTRIVSPKVQAATWPAGTSSRQPFGPLRNIPTGAAAAQDRPSTTVIG